VSNRRRSRSDATLPVVTAVVLGVTVLVTALHATTPGLLPPLRRDPNALSAGEWWRLFTPLLVQADPWWATFSVFVGVLVVGVAVERTYGRRDWLALYFGGGVVGELAGYAWQPHGSGASVAGAGLLGGLCVWLLWRGKSIPLGVRIWGPVWLAVGVLLTFLRDIHGPPLLFGACLGAVLLWRERD
jgi:rhomboid protease GluP